MLYVICKAKNKIASNERTPKYNPENWEIIETVKCRKNATMKTYDSIFVPVYQRLIPNGHGYNSEQEHIRLWNFKEEDINA